MQGTLQAAHEKTKETSEGGVMFIPIWAVCVILGMCLIGVIGSVSIYLIMHKLLDDLEDANTRVRRYEARQAFSCK